MPTVRQFFSFKNEHTVLFLILALVGGAYGLERVYPDYQFYILGVAAAGIISMMAVMNLNAYIVGRAHRHIDLQLWKRGDPPRDWHFDLYVAGHVRAAQPVVDVFALMTTNPRAANILRYMGGLFWYPYIVDSVNTLEFPLGRDEVTDTSDSLVPVTRMAILLPHPWTKFLGFTEREWGAYMSGTQYTHPASAHLEAVIAPFTLDFLGQPIPIIIGFSSSSTVKSITDNWQASENELARHLTHFDKIIQENNIHVFPEQNVNEIGIRAAVDGEAERAELRKKIIKLQGGE